MKRIMFVCLGNICRSPMAEFMFTDLIRRRRVADKFIVASAATSAEEEGNHVHYGTVSKLRAEGIPVWDRRATRLRKSDYGEYDLFLGMDSGNVQSMKRLFDGDKENKVKRVLDFTNTPRDIADPWYTGNFDDTFDDLQYGLDCLLNELLNDNA